MNEANTARHDALVRATRPELMRPRPGMVLRLGAGYPKRLYRQIKVAYRGTHELLGELSFRTVYTPQLLVRAVDNHRQAEALLNKARAMPRTLLGARIRLAALDNASVAFEALESIACTANRAPQLF